MPKNKIFWMDTETSSLDSKHGDILQLAVLVDIDGIVEDRKFWELRPLDPLSISDEALECNMLTREQIMMFRPTPDVFKEIIHFLDKHISKFDKTDKFWIAGYNVRFDIDFLRALFDKMGHKYYGSYFKNYYLDVMELMMLNSFISGIIPESFKLIDVAKSFNLEGINFHNASADINTTRELFLRLLAEIKNKKEDMEPF